MCRNARFWSRYTADAIGAIIVSVAVLEGISFLFGYGFESFASFAMELRMLLIIAAAAVLFMLNSGAQTTYIPMLLSFGETRKTVFIGYTVTRITICIVTVLMNVILAFACGGAEYLESLPTMALTLLTVSSLGGITGTLLIRQKWLGMLLLVVAFGGIGMAIGFFSTVTGTQKLAERLHEISSVSAPWWLVALAFALLLIDLIYHWAVLCRREVKL